MMKIGAWTAILWLSLQLLATRFAAEEEEAPSAGQSAAGGGLCFGIDLGTTFSSIAINDHSKREIILNRHGNSITPSIVGFAADGQILVGEEAQSIQDPKSLVRTVKRIMGRKFDEQRVQQEKEMVSHEIVADSEGMAAIKIGSKIYTPQEISAKILENQIESAYRYTKTHHKGERKVDGAVITVPAYFKSNERNATMEAAKQAGIKLLKIVSEPVSAAIANTDQNLTGYTVVIDVGGGTSDVSLLHIEDGIYDSQSTTGDAHLGGVDFDRLILELLKEAHGSKIDELIKSAKFNPYKYAEMLKIQLTSKQIVDYTLPDGTSGSISRAKFNEKMKPFVDKIGDLITEALKIIELNENDIQNYLLVGGSSRIPALSQMIEKRFKKKPILSDQPDHAIAIGASIVAAQQCGHSDAETILISHIPFGIGVKALQGSQTVTVFIIDRNSAVPVKKTKSFSTAFDNQPAVTVEILQGFSMDVNENTKIGEVHYDKLPLARAGKVEVEVEFHITENQVITATVKGAFENAETRSHTLTLTKTNLTEEEIEKHQVSAERRRMIMEAILEIENKFSQAFYFIDSDITKSSLDASHVKFLEEIRQKWKEMKEKVYNNKEISDGEIEEFKSLAAKLHEEAEPVIQKVVESGSKAASDYDQNAAGNAASDPHAGATAGNESADL